MKFSDISFHRNAIDRLRRMADEDRIPHAILIDGPEGIGKFALARAFAQYVHCENHTPDGDSCGVCRSCRLHQALNHTDLHFSFPVVKLENMTSPPVSDDFLNEWRDFVKSNRFMSIDSWASTFTKKNAQPMIYAPESSSIIHKLSLTSHISRYQILILWLPERLGSDTANKLLKLVEEPLEDTLIIMVSNDSKSILPTISSRLQRVTLRPLSDQTVTSILMEENPLDENDAKAIAHLSLGNMIEAMRQLSLSEEQSSFFEMFKSLMRLAYQRKIKDLREWANDLAALGREKELKFYEYTSRLIRENFIYNFALPELNYLNSAEGDFSRNFARFITERNVEKLIEVFDNARTDIAGNGNGKIINLDVAIKTILLLKS